MLIVYELQGPHWRRLCDVGILIYFQLLWSSSLNRSWRLPPAEHPVATCSSWASRWRTCLFRCACLAWACASFILSMMSVGATRRVAHFGGRSIFGENNNKIIVIENSWCFSSKRWNFADIQYCILFNKLKTRRHFFLGLLSPFNSNAHS